jgi:hypothetical protein
MEVKKAPATCMAVLCAASALGGCVGGCGDNQQKEQMRLLEQEANNEGVCKNIYAPDSKLGAFVRNRVKASLGPYCTATCRGEDIDIFCL